MTASQNVEYRSSVESALVVVGNEFETGKVFYTDTTGFYPAHIDNLTHAGFDATIWQADTDMPRPNGRRHARFDQGNILWGGSLFTRQAKPFTGELTLTATADEPRVGRFFLAGKGDGSVVYASSHLYGYVETYRVYIGLGVDTQSGTLPRAIVHKVTSDRGFFEIVVEIVGLGEFSINVADGTWDNLGTENYSFVETLDEVTFTRKG